MDLLTAVVDDCLVARDKRLFTAVPVVLDQSKALDNVQHQILLIMLTVTLPDRWYHFWSGSAIICKDGISEFFSGTRCPNRSIQLRCTPQQRLWATTVFVQDLAQLLTYMELICPRLRTICPFTAFLRHSRRSLSSCISCDVHLK